METPEFRIVLQATLIRVDGSVAISCMSIGEYKPEEEGNEDLAGDALMLCFEATKEQFQANIQGELDWTN